MLSPSPSARMVHVVDDDASFRQSVARLLRIGGYDVQAFESAAAYAALPYPSPACLLLDIHMPGMTGLELHEQLRGRGQLPPVVFVTGVADAGLRAQAERGGATLLSKPVSAAELFDAIGSAIANEPRDTAPRAPGIG